MLSEDLYYEKLNGTVSVRGFMIATVAIFEEAVDSLINRVFRKTDFVVQSVIDFFINDGLLVISVYVSKCYSDLSDPTQSIFRRKCLYSI